MSFQHRAEVDQLRTAVDSGGTAVLSQVLTGTGGVGKTQLAADYARTAWDSGGVDVLVWISASSRSAITAGYAQAGVEVLAADPSDPEQSARAFVAWLEPKAGQKPCRWLVVLDDVADPADMRGWWPPTSPHGRTLVTTRRRDAALTGDGRRLVEVGLFTADEAVAYLTASLAVRGRAEPVDQLTALAADLGYLALALAQAAAYIIDSGETAAAYRDLLTDRATKLTDLAPDALPDEQAVALAAAWSLTIARADTLRPVGLARPMLHLAAVLDANGIPQDVLTGEVARAHLAAHRTTTGPSPTAEPAPVSRLDAVRALRALDRLSLIDHRPGTPHQAVRVHQLIQRATRDTLTPDQRDQYARTAADALMAAWPETERDTALAQALRTNADALIRNSRDAVLWQPDGHRVLQRSGISLGDSGQVAAAVEYFEYLVDATSEHLGPDHSDTLIARRDLACWRQEAGDVAGAVTAYTELIEHMQRVLGPDHPAVLTARGGLAHARGEAGEAAAAATVYAELLADRERVQGLDASPTLATRKSLAWWQGQAGDMAGAVTTLTKLLEHVLRLLGPDHHFALTVRCDLAYCQGEAGDKEGAVTAYTELFQHALQVLGPDHRDTLTIRHQLAVAQLETGDVAGAVTALTELLEHALNRMNLDHPAVLAVRHDLAYSQETAGDVASAVAAYIKLLADRERVLGPNHPETLLTRSNLVRCRGKAGNATAH
ncbi:FxSxx-COOH system tetratricopeptide repeat protein [Streptomyces sp. NPDC015346]|uniref:FxSxx-COOH system tetratricopeptide repeat protein n=1 Tax=Streptomyces sp. NPDC015346 TaxID=3364954 RepID=UPI0036FA18EE